MLHTDCVPDSALSVLRELSGLPALAGFYLAGGTSLALRFGHRVSVDLDFFTPDPFTPDSLVEVLPSGRWTAVNAAPHTLSLDWEGTKVEFFRHAYDLLFPVEELEGFRLASIADVSAMKINAIVNRGSKKDFYDVVRLLEDASVESLLDNFVRKYANADRFIAVKSLTWFDDADLEPDPTGSKLPSWTEVKERMREVVSGL